MMLSIDTYKISKTAGKPFYKTYRYPCFDIDSTTEDESFISKFNYAVKALKEEILEDQRNDDIDQYSNIVIYDVWLS